MGENVVKVSVCRNPKTGRGWVARVLKDGRLKFLEDLNKTDVTNFYFVPQEGEFYIVCDDQSSHKHTVRYFVLYRYTNGKLKGLIVCKENNHITIGEKRYENEEMLNLLLQYGVAQVPRGKNRYVQFLIKKALEMMAEEATPEEVAEEIEEIKEIITEEEKQKIRETVMRNRFKQVTIVTFRLPTEYIGSKRTYKDGVEKIELKHDPNTFRTLRSMFYAILKKIAWNSRLGWILVSNPSDKHISGFNAIVKRLNEMTKRNRIVEFVEIQIPRHTLRTWLAEYITELKESKELLEQKIAEEIEEAEKLKRAERRLAELEKRIKDLEKELKEL
ncbi:hypothetical protein DRH14_04470 [Candidatus Shapirobacteria bacterium]|nr:MAG: hypothetical protein DRH14_04470 [Candidatus Shapirobacteria bacterium]